MPKERRLPQKTPGPKHRKFVGPSEQRANILTGGTTKKGKKGGKNTRQTSQAGSSRPSAPVPPVPRFPQTTIVAHNPFDDQPFPQGPGPMQMPSYHPQRPVGPPYSMHNKPPGPPMMHPHPGSGKVYPPHQPMVFNPSNPNAPPIYPCGVCHKEVHDNDQAILCESGCNFWFHRMCTGLTEGAYLMLTQEVYAEWACDKCLSTKNIPLVKMKP